jgi:hypothetical protein
MPGCTLVVSPLVALIRDQDLHLQEKQSQCAPSFVHAGYSLTMRDSVECLTFTAKMPLAKINEGYNRLRDTTGKEVKLCYVTVRLSLPTYAFKSD